MCWNPASPLDLLYLICLPHQSPLLTPFTFLDSRHSFLVTLSRLHSSSLPADVATPKFWNDGYHGYLETALQWIQVWQQVRRGEVFCGPQH